MKRDIVIRPQADADLDEQADYIALDSLESSKRFYEAAQKVFR